MSNLTKAESARIDGAKSLGQPTNQIEIGFIADMVAARRHLRPIWRFETAILDIKMNSQSPDFEKRFQKYDEDTRRGVAISLADKSKRLSTALRHDIHLSRTYRMSLQELYRLRGARLRNEPTEPAKSRLNGKKEVLNGDQKEENPTHEHIFVPKFVPEPKALSPTRLQEFQSERDPGILFYFRLKLTFGAHPAYIA